MEEAEAQLTLVAPSLQQATASCPRCFLSGTAEGAETLNFTCEEHLGES